MQTEAALAEVFGTSAWLRCLSPAQPNSKVIKNDKGARGRALTLSLAGSHQVFAVLSARVMQGMH